MLDKKLPERYRDYWDQLGWRVFPCVGKAPVKGCYWQTEAKPGTDEQWAQATGAGLVIPRGVIVIDLDIHLKGCPKPWPKTCACPDIEPLRNKFREYPTPLSVKTPTGGYHLYYKATGFKAQNSTKRLHPQVDTKTDGGYVMLPPSAHDIADGEYEWEDLDAAVENGFDLTTLPEAPLFILNALQSLDDKKMNMRPSEIFKQRTFDGDRNDQAAYHAGVFWHYFAKKQEDVNDENLRIITAVMLEWDKGNKPPLGKDRIVMTCKSIGKTHYGGLRK